MGWFGGFSTPIFGNQHPWYPMNLYTFEHWKKPGCLGDIGDEILPSYRDDNKIRIPWVVPPPSNSGKWRFWLGFPIKNVTKSWWSRLHPGRGTTQRIPINQPGFHGSCHVCGFLSLHHLRSEEVRSRDLQRVVNSTSPLWAEALLSPIQEWNCWPFNWTERKWDNKDPEDQ